MRILQLNNNPLGDITAGTFYNVRKINTLQLQFTELTHLTAGVFDGLAQLKWLWLYNCKIATIDAGAFLNMRSIWEIYLFNNPDLATLPYGVFQDTPDLKHLYLQGTKLEPVSCCHLVGLNKWLDIKWPEKAYLDTLACRCDAGAKYIDCSRDFPGLQQDSCPITYTFNTAASSRMRINLPTIVASTIIAMASLFVL